MREQRSAARCLPPQIIADIISLDGQQSQIGFTRKVLCERSIDLRCCGLMDIAIFNINRCTTGCAGFQKGKHLIGTKNFVNEHGPRHGPCRKNGQAVVQQETDVRSENKAGLAV